MDILRARQEGQNLIGAWMPWRSKNFFLAKPEPHLLYYMRIHNALSPRESLVPYGSKKGCLLQLEVPKIHEKAARTVKKSVLKPVAMGAAARGLQPP